MATGRETGTEAESNLAVAEASAAADWARTASGSTRDGSGDGLSTSAEDRVAATGRADAAVEITSAPAPAAAGMPTAGSAGYDDGNLDDDDEALMQQALALSLEGGLMRDVGEGGGGVAGSSSSSGSSSAGAGGSRGEADSTED